MGVMGLVYPCLAAVDGQADVRVGACQVEGVHDLLNRGSDAVRLKKAHPPTRMKSLVKVRGTGMIPHGYQRSRLSTTKVRGAGGRPIQLHCLRYFQHPIVIPF